METFNSVSTARSGCVRCVLKHLASAAVLAQEVLNGHNDFEHRFALEGHLAEAEQEITALDAGFAGLLRGMRRATFDTEAGFSFPARRLTMLKHAAEQIDKLDQAGFFRRRTTAEPCCGHVADTRVPDVLFPLSTQGSKVDFDELRFALRSIAANLTNFGKIRIVADRKIEEYFFGIEWTVHQNNMPRKQMNIHLSLVDAMSEKDAPERFIFWADDNVVLKKTDARAMPLVGRSDDLARYLGRENTRVWHQSLAQTAEMLQKRGLPTTNFEAHTPIELEREKYLKIAGEFNYLTGVGPCYLSLYANALKLKPTKQISEVKATFESDKTPVTKLPNVQFAGYADGGVKMGILQRLLERFPDPSPWERFPEARLYGDAVTAGVVVGTCKGSAAYLELQLAALRKFADVPVLVVCDGAAEDEEMKRAAAKFDNVEYQTLGQDFGHTAGDLAIYAAGLRWAAARGFDLMVKLSRRFIPLKAWLPGLLERAKEADAPALTSYTTSFGYHFRTECAALNVKAWREVLPEMDASAMPGKKFSVEKWMQARSLEVAHRHLTPKFCHTRIVENNAPERYGYALWTDVLGTDRKALPEGVLWHDVHTAQDYAKAAAGFGLPLLQRFS